MTSKNPPVLVGGHLEKPWSLKLTIPKKGSPELPGPSPKTPSLKIEEIYIPPTHHGSHGFPTSISEASELELLSDLQFGVGSRWLTVFVGGSLVHGIFFGGKHSKGVCLLYDVVRFFSIYKKSLEVLGNTMVFDFFNIYRVGFTSFAICLRKA